MRLNQLSKRRRRFVPALELLEKRELLSSTPNQLYILQVYRDVLQREAEAGGLAYWTGLLDNGTPRFNVAVPLVHSAEFYSNIIVQPAFAKFLGRLPDQEGLAFWVDQMLHHGLTDEHLEAGFMGSPEYFTHSGGTNLAWVDAMYPDLLGRPADQAGEDFWVGKLNHGASREAVSYGFAASPEREGQRIQGDYSRYLGRDASAADVAFWVDQFANHGQTNENIIVDFLAEPEYFQRSQDSVPPTITLTSPDAGVISPTNVTVAGRVTDGVSGVASLQGQVDSGTAFAVSLDAAGAFRFDTTLPVAGSANGSHTIHLVASDRAMNAEARHI